ncbi:lipid II:glycine glycyltransferase (peptidoglycan interpeptide bridge formation enzyme) [Deinococcus metalli]|uniref:Lipid II:glycine glycyltransferase (Peptidoglycan interpeptide bridge formation enzyme) n=1 Tax=Deinococcus metalli TaxID=1141878 RepID=A0A7W8NTJ2_9DEIO|nr:peptidoglycan bridge formation glycyltransferase FemA/FemB family protein [Deinococcus metalli]MBB5378232.1 lipid II:glycine glycyltransferase (peptidoglycan interpeptide bridge formation enzyme) [Deinococcus metalli]GHF57021.1 peptidoglycan bridge formation protein FemAB [Deinococcus metalli]
MRLTLAPTSDPRVYDDVVAHLPITSALQGWGYGEARRALGQEPARYLIQQGGRTVGAVQLLRKRLVPGLSTLYAPRGPALESVDLLPDVAQAIRSVARPTDALLKIEPPVPLPAVDGAEIPDAYGPFRRAETEQPEHTIIADLRSGEDELFAGLNQMARRNVRTAQKLGVTAGRDDDFDAFWEIFTATNERAKLGAFPRRYYETMLREGNAHGGEAYLVLSRYQGRALAGGFFLAMGKGTAYLFGGSVRDDRMDDAGQPLKDSKAPDAFYWHAMLDAKRRGYELFDFWGIPRVLDESKHSYGVFRMKLKFSEQRVWYPAYDLPLNPAAPAIVKALRWRKTQNNLRKRGSADDVL